MQVHTGHPTPWISYVIMFAVIGVVLAFRMRRMSRMRPLRLEYLWVVPALYGAIAVLAFASHLPSPLGWSLSLVGLAAGGAIGWQRGRMMHIHIDPETHALNQKASPAAILFIVALIVVREGARMLAESGSATSMHINALLVTDVLIAFALGMFALQRLEMFLRARRMLNAARARA
ncbi:hypothetical protein GCM10023219_07860 [Stakelama sediminis]|uniref:DUF1453 family protein n=1 Tax=Stakelama sediminis TaxID=463200 RepID=A0A840YVC0_9SPHN|nr:CcdC protein domain-containing protein [Stakelama sediminis]MBB5717507.1 hypothetical protein [Stakelama sediminis]